MCFVCWAAVVMSRAALKARVAQSASPASPVTCLPFSHLASLSSTLNHAYHLYIPGSSESPVKRIGCAALSRFAIASFAASIPFNTHHEDASGLQPSNQDIPYLSLPNGFGGPPQHLQEVPPAPLKSPPSPPRLHANPSPLPLPFATRESTVTTTPSRCAGPITTPSQHGVQAPLQNPTTHDGMQILLQHQLNTARKSRHDASRK
ncbi:hypothetical protein EDB86DRAFT_3098951 [Lactarius hatsudake]|nr:hypothetical protein EDB86DRAFT_3098951 [Lactarius hatsudake]